MTFLEVNKFLTTEEKQEDSKDKDNKEQNNNNQNIPNNNQKWGI